VSCDENVSVFEVETADLICCYDLRGTIYNMEMGLGQSAKSNVNAGNFGTGDITIDFLGLSFMKNRLALFCFGQNEIRLATRAYQIRKEREWPGGN
jgi:hypothetical protein